MGKNFWIVLGVVVIAGLGLMLFAGSDSNTSDDATSDSALAVQENDHKRGLPGSAVVVVEYGDFQCPACSALAPVVDLMFVEFGDQVEFVFRHFPLTSIHPNAMASHRSAEAASQQGAFWEMHDLLYQRQQSWSTSLDATSIFEGYASELGLDVEQYSSSVASEETLSAITADLNSGQAVGVRGTPTYFVAGEQIPTPQSVEAFREAIQSALDAANGTETSTESVPETDTDQ